MWLIQRPQSPAYWHVIKTWVLDPRDATWFGREEDARNMIPLASNATAVRYMAPRSYWVIAATAGAYFCHVNSGAVLYATKEACQLAIDAWKGAPGRYEPLLLVTP